MKEDFLDTNKLFEIFCYTPQLCARKEEANKVQIQALVTFIIVKRESFGELFYPPCLLSEDVSKNATC